VSNLPPFLKEQEGFSGIQYDLKRIMEQGKPLTTDQTRPLPNLEPVYCESCFDWIQRYYRDIPYLQAQLNQVMTQTQFWKRKMMISELASDQIRSEPTNVSRDREM
jgi:hypothetical protein